MAMDPELLDGYLESRAILKQGMVRDILAAARGLVRITLIFDPEKRFDYDENSFATLHRLFRNNHWPQLTLIDICGVKAGEQSTLSFLPRHASTLKIMHLADISLSGRGNGTWTTLLERMHAILHLDGASFQGTFADLRGGYNPRQNIEMDSRIPRLGELSRGRALRYLFCRKKTPSSGKSDSTISSDFNWDTITFADIPP
jgi:hypothetical protein